jgi:FAD/FMN-containing dehydrogenase
VAGVSCNIVACVPLVTSVSPLPSGDEDVRITLAWARQHKVAVAVRTGGHQYSGASSTCGPNLQLDLSRTYRDIAWLDDRTLEVGISISLISVNGWHALFELHS